MVFKKKQAELDSIKALDREKGSLGEIMAKATPSKQTGELRRSLPGMKLVESKEKSLKEEDQVSELKNEIRVLQKQMDTKTAQHATVSSRSEASEIKFDNEARAIPSDGKADVTSVKL
jgi:hypothetical protein